MSVSVYLKEDYEDFHAFEVAKNKANLLSFSVLCSADSVMVLSFL